MQIRHLEMFIAVAEEQHFSRAAERENIVQSGISAAIRALEEELGVQLFIRSTRRVELSATGRIFLPEAMRILDAVRTAKETVAGVREGLSGKLAIGTIQSLTPFVDLPQLLERFHTRHPKVKLVVQEAHLSSLIDGLSAGTLDLAFMPVAQSVPQALEFDILATSPMVVTYADDHRLARTQITSLGDISDEPFVEFSSRWGTRQFVDDLFASEGFKRTSDYEVESYDLVSQFVRRGLGLAIMPEGIAVHRKLAYKHLVSTQPGKTLPLWKLGLFRARNSGNLPLNPPADLFRKEVEAHFESNAR